MLIRTDAAGATHGFATAAREVGCGSSLGFPIKDDVQAAVLSIPAQGWTPAYDIDGASKDLEPARRRDSRPPSTFYPQNPTTSAAED